jgi:twitching motility protein PilT
MIRENKLAQMRSTLQTSAGEGMQTMDQSLQKLMAQGLVSREAALKKATNPATLMANDGMRM